MSLLRIPLSLLLTLVSTAALADFHIESNDAGDGFLQVAVVNGTQANASRVELSYFGSVFAVDAPGWSCSGNKCALDGLPAGQSASLKLLIAFDQPYVRKRVELGAAADVAGKRVLKSEFAFPARYLRFAVAHDGDSGAGSLRAAIEAVNADAVCAALPCAIDLPAATIRPWSPLPRITARDVLVTGPAVLDGSATTGNALDFAGAERAEVDGLTIVDFGDNAILLRPLPTASSLKVAHCDLERNLRGVNFAAGGYFDTVIIRDNTIRDHIRSAVFDGSDGAPGFSLGPRIRIERNRISGNGASGIFLGERSDGALIVDNVIESNHDFGIAVARGAHNVRILQNSIAHNGSAIDIGLDGPTLLLPLPTGDRSAAVIESATYDPATNTTTIAGKPSVTPIGICDLCITHIVSLYANDAAEHGEFAEAQNYLGDAQPNGSGFVLTFNGDLRGKYITALATRWVNGVGSDFFDTAELSKAFLVQ